MLGNKSGFDLGLKIKIPGLIHPAPTECKRTTNVCGGAPTACGRAPAAREGLNSFARGLRSGAWFLLHKNKATPYGNNVALVCLHISKLVLIYYFLFFCCCAIWNPVLEGIVRCLDEHHQPIPLRNIFMV